MAITSSNLRKNLYTILDQVAETGVALEIIHKGSRMHIIADQPDLFGRLKKHPEVLSVKPDDIVHMDWSDHWQPALP